MEYGFIGFFTPTALRFIIYSKYMCLLVQYPPPAILGGYVPSPPANTENPRIIDSVLKRLCMVLYTLKCVPKHIIKTVLLINNVVICSNYKLKTVIMQHNMYIVMIMRERCLASRA